MKLLKLCIFSVAFFSAVGSANGAALINGAGATFPSPLYMRWSSEFQKVRSDVRINYQSIGSGAGIKQFIEKTVDFGATDLPMTDEQLKVANEPVLHIPTVLGAVVLTYNLPALAGKPLRFSSDIVADIYLGKIKKWNDERIAKENPGVVLPDTEVLVVARADGSGTTGIFTDYLSKISAEWKTRVGSATAVKWPVGLKEKGNEGVTGRVKLTEGAIGYVELIYAKNNGLPYASIKNKAGAFVEPSEKAVTAAAAGALKNMPSDFRVSITNADGKESYPISGFTYLLVRKTQVAGEKSQNLLSFLKWAIGDGQMFASALHYAPLPSSLAKKVQAEVAKIRLQ